MLDGGPTSQNAPTGGGNLIIGVRNNDFTPSTRFEGCLDEIAIGDEILPIETIRALALGASPIPTPPRNEGFVITDYDYNPTTGAVSLTWNSRAGVSYSVNYGTDLESFDGVVNNAVPSGGESTTYSFNQVILGPDANAPRLFFRISEN